MTPHFWNDAVKHLSEKDKVLKNIIESYSGEALMQRSNGFYTLTRSIIGQQISVKAAASVWYKLREKLDEITPEKLLCLDDDELRKCGLSARKIRYIQGVAEYFVENEDRVNSWHAMADENVLSELTALHGIGRWTAEMFLIFYLARPDVFPLADIGLQKAMFKHYNNDKEIPKEKLVKIANNWQPYRSVATWYLWRSLDPEPVAY
ncbi:MAG: DNA-3-methyladenine glycosylase [Rickettsiales bacterium]